MPKYEVLVKNTEYGKVTVDVASEDEIEDAALEEAMGRSSAWSKSEQNVIRYSKMIDQERHQDGI